MARSISKQKITEHLSRKLNLKKKYVAAILADIEKKSLRQSKTSFRAPGIGKIVVVGRKARIGPTSATIGTIQIPSKGEYKFRASSGAKTILVVRVGPYGPGEPPPIDKPSRKKKIVIRQ